MRRLNIQDSALVLLSSVFFIWGLITVASNSLIPHYKEVFSLDYQTVMLFPMAFFITRITVSLPTSFVMAKIGYKKTLKYCLYWCLIGCLAMAYFVLSEQLSLTLLGIFLMASGISAIQVVSSPYVSLLSTSENSMRRQGVATASNSIGTVLGPIILSFVIIVAGMFGFAKTSQQVSILFLLIALFLLGQIIYFRSIDLPDIKSTIQTGFWRGLIALLKNPAFIKLAVVLLLYVGVEVCFGTFTIIYLADKEFGNLGLVASTQLIAGYWAFMFLGRFLFVKYGYLVDSLRLFVIMCLLSIVVCLIAIQINHVAVGYLMILVGLFNSTLYPIIYSQALKSAKQFSSQGAALLIMCSIGGAILPLAQAVIIDSFELNTSYLVPAISYAVMIWLFMSSLKSSKGATLSGES